MIIFVRHGQTDWNAEGRLQGQHDIPLNDHGRGQARGNGRKIAALLSDPASFDFVSSPLHRTRETMELMRGAIGLDPGAYRTDERLVEVCFGAWEGSTLAELQRTDPVRLAERDADKWNFIPPGDNAESYEILSWRVGSWLSAVREPTICVCHGGVVRAIFVLTGMASREDAAHLDIPQDKILIWDGKALVWR